MEGHFGRTQPVPEHMHDTELGVRRITLWCNLVCRWDSPARILSGYFNLEHVSLMEPRINVSWYYDSTAEEYVQQQLAQAGARVPQFEYLDPT
jgi:hypothetical protein